MKKFNELVADQFRYGGVKYALSDERESTDVLFERYGQNWLFGTMDKYCFRFRNLARERDLLKIACYAYILWLKKGFHVDIKGLSVDALDTNVQMKADNFDKFVDVITDGANKIEIRKIKIKYTLDQVSAILKEWAKKKWSDISLEEIVLIYLLCYYVWREKYENVEQHDTDTYLESKKNASKL